MAYQQGEIFENFNENAKFVEMVKQFGCSKSTIVTLNFLKNYFKLIMEICKENASEIK